MANRNFDDVQILGKGRKIIAGSFRPNGSSAVDNTLNTGAGFTVARTGTGTFTITLSDTYPALVASSFQVALSAAAASFVVIGAVDTVTNKTIAITNMTESAGSFAAADIASNAANRVHFILIMRNTAVTP